MSEELRSLSWWPSLYEPFHQLGTRIAEWFTPPSEVADHEDDYLLKVELPGVAIEDVEVTVTGDVLTVSGEKTRKREETENGRFFSEIRYGAFRRSFKLPPDANAEGVDAAMKDGVMTLRVAKREPKSSVRSIPISA